MVGMKSKTTPVESDVCSLETALREASDKVAKMRARRDALIAERRKLEERRWAFDAAARDELDDAARAVLADPEGALAVTDIEARLRQIAAESAVVDRAFTIARDECDMAKKRHAAAVTKSLRPAHKKAVNRIAVAIRELDDANKEEIAIRARAPGSAPLPVASFAPASIPAWFAFVGSYGLLANGED